MSKAFTKESDDELPDLPGGQLPSASLPPGVRNHLTPGGAQRLRDELTRLTHGDRPDDPLSRARLSQQVAELERALASAEIVPLPERPEDRTRVVFGAAVTVREVRTGEESCYRIVGVDEVDWGEDRVSLYAPIARALLNARLGERVRFRFPAGEEELEIVAINYDP